MNEIRTHRKANNKFCGIPIEVTEGKAIVKLKTTEEMVVDEMGLVHGGFIFSAADYSAMLAVNHPNVVLAKAQVNFLKPVKVGDEVTFEALVEKVEGRKYTVKVEAKKKGDLVFNGTFLCIITNKHVLSKE